MQNGLYLAALRVRVTLSKPSGRFNLTRICYTVRLATRIL